MRTFLIITSFAEHFVNKIKKRSFEVFLPDLNREKKRYFPDGEIYIRLSKVKEMKRKRVIILHSGEPKPNEGLIELELILQILKENNIKPEIFFTYFPYGRQDKIFVEGETNAAENLVKKLINYYQVKKIYVIDAHFWEREWIKKYPIINISATPFLMEKVKKEFANHPTRHQEEILFLAVDIGGQRRFKIAGFDKIRKNSFHIELKLSEKLVNLIRGKAVCLVDDLIQTGGTLLKAYELTKKYGAKKVSCLATHGLLKEGVAKISKKFAQIYLTNTIYQPKIPQIDITQIILKAIKK